MTLLAVHAHPDDESSKGAATVAKYITQGTRCTLVSATGGEAGEVLNPALDQPETWENLAAVRAAELDEAVAIIGYQHLYRLGYRDSGMPDSDANKDPLAFWNVPVTEAAAQLVRIIREEKPDVVLTYAEDQNHYPHPDHLRVHEISLLAFELASDATFQPELGEPHEVAKLYYDMRHRRWHNTPEELAIEDDQARWNNGVTTRIDVSEYLDIRRKALLAHRTQIDPESSGWSKEFSKDREEINHFDDYSLARCSIPGYVISEPKPESDLFQGL